MLTCFGGTYYPMGEEILQPNKIVPCERNCFVAVTNSDRESSTVITYGCWDEAESSHGAINYHGPMHMIEPGGDYVYLCNDKDICNYPPPPQISRTPQGTIWHFLVILVPLMILSVGAYLCVRYKRKKRESKGDIESNNDIQCAVLPSAPPLLSSPGRRTSCPAVIWSQEPIRRTQSHQPIRAQH